MAEYEIGVIIDYRVRGYYTAFVVADSLEEATALAIAQAEEDAGYLGEEDLGQWEIDGMDIDYRTVKKDDEYVFDDLEIGDQ